MTTSNIEKNLKTEGFAFKVKSRARSAYETYYKEEEKLNESFRCFVQNFKRAYEGRNTRKCQVPKLKRAIPEGDEGKIS